MADNKLLAKVGIGLIFLAALAGAFGAGVWYGRSVTVTTAPITGVTNLATGEPSDVDFSIFWKTWGILNNKFVNGNSTSTAIASTVSNQEKVWGAVSGLVSSLGDPYTVFLPPEQKQNFESDIRGNFGGVGMELGIKNNVVTAISALPDTPSARAGMRPGDQILKVNDQLTDTLSVDKVVQLIRGEPGTVVKLLVGRTGREPFTVSITRAVINIPSVKTETKDGVFIIHLYNFSEPAPNAFRSALREFIGAGTDKMIIDLRGNPGGYLEAAVDIASWFLPEGKVVVKEYHGGKSEDKVYRSSGYNLFTDKLKLAILVDGGSASAAEILAGALSEYGKGPLVGEKTFGKGSVQELIDIDGQSSLKVTIAKWLTPNGVSISHNGLTPQVVVPLTDDDRAKGLDPQLAKAIQILQNQVK